MILEAIVVIGLVGAVIYGTILVLTRPSRPPATAPGHWRTAHYDSDGRTRVVLEKVGRDGRRALDEHVVATIRVDDPDYDAKFLEAMSQARERRALFESEEAD